ncbi:hypothetical protein AVEN_246963-1 [Araneus ventricosus]|uniref:Uncharacterized protein n=1 Tax=Araneus ventricosus TaxID=182803 RepID=A0A4Y2JMI2_ARAVE|nr:hypothetical protein AVEN_246963-1 [Araneus ventricosus]
MTSPPLLPLTFVRTMRWRCAPSPSQPLPSLLWLLARGINDTKANNVNTYRRARTPFSFHLTHDVRYDGLMCYVGVNRDVDTNQLASNLRRKRKDGGSFPESMVLLLEVPLPRSSGGRVGMERNFLRRLRVGSVLSEK